MRSNIIAFPGRQHDPKDPLDRQNFEHAFIAMHVAAQYDEDRIDGFLRGLIDEGRADDIADLLENNTRAIRYLVAALDFLFKADTAIAAKAEQLIREACKENSGPSAARLFETTTGGADVL